MAKKDIRFTLDTIDSKYSPVGTVKQLDSVFFYIKITENGVTKDLTGQTIKLFAIKEDKKIVEQTTKINTTNETEGLVEIELLNSAIQAPGFTYFELEISDNTGIISTSDFILRVDRKVGSDEAIESTNEVATLKEIEIYVAQAKVELQRFKELQTEMLRTNETINSNEEGRVSAEEKRVNAENKRALAEEERGTLFTQKEEERGTLFAQKELDRNNTFAQRERERNEKFEDAESDRAVAESERVIAEQIREEKFAGFENKIGANTEELNGARTATTGEQFNSLDERIDCEIDRLNKKIEVSMLQQESAESHVVENSVEGMITNMIIKGRTLQNLWNPIDIYWQTNSKWFISPETAIKFSITGKIITVKNITDKTINFQFSKLDDNYDSQIVISSGETKIINVTSTQKFRGIIALESLGWENTEENKNKLKNGLIVCVGEYSCLPNIYFKGIKSFGQQEDKISILSHGFNLFDYKTMYSTDWIDGNGKIIKTDGSKYFSIKVPIYKTNIKYYITGDVINRFNVGYLDDSDNVITYKVYASSNSIELDVAPNNAKYILAYLNAQGYDNGISNGIMVSIDTPSEYLPYSDLDKKDILFSKYGFDEGLRGLNNSVYDELNDIKNVAIKRIGKHIFTGNENIRQLENNTKALIVLVENIKGVDSKYFISNSNIGYEIRWNVNEWENNYPIAFNFKDSSAGSMSLLISKSKIPAINDVDSLKQYLRENNIELYYQLKEPVETYLDESISLKVYDEKTYVSFENSINGTSSFKAPVNTVATIARLNRENRALEEENVKLKVNMIKQTIYFENEDKKMTDYTLDMDFKMCLMEMDIEDIKANLGGDINAKK